MFVNCLAKHGKLLQEAEAENDVLLEAAETRDKRQEKLDHFFREAYSRAFNVPKLSDSSSEFNRLGFVVWYSSAVSQMNEVFSISSEQVLHMTLR